MLGLFGLGGGRGGDGNYTYNLPDLDVVACINKVEIDVSVVEIEVEIEQIEICEE